MSGVALTAHAPLCSVRYICCKRLTGSRKFPPESRLAKRTRKQRIKQDPGYGQ